MSSPLQSFFSELRLETGVSSFVIVDDNAITPCESKTEKKLETTSYDEPCKPIRPHRIAAKGISFLASTLPKELQPVVTPKEDQEKADENNLYTSLSCLHLLKQRQRREKQLKREQIRRLSQRMAVANSAA